MEDAGINRTNNTVWNETRINAFYQEFGGVTTTRPEDFGLPQLQPLEEEQENNIKTEVEEIIDVGDIVVVVDVGASYLHPSERLNWIGKYCIVEIIYQRHKNYWFKANIRNNDGVGLSDSRVRLKKPTGLGSIVKKGDTIGKPDKSSE